MGSIPVAGTKKPLAFSEWLFRLISSFCTIKRPIFLLVKYYLFY